MILYHFLNTKYGIASIKERRLKIAHIEKLNDPFEFLGVELADREFRAALIKRKKDIAKEKGILCFSKNRTNPLLWSHYADKHKGICLGFKIPENRLIKIKYTNFRFPHSKELKELDERSEDFMNKLLRTKFKPWRYEREYRMCVPLEEKIDNLYYTGFDKAELKLIRVIVGCRSDTTRSQVSSALGNLVDSVDVFKSRMAFKSFKVVKNNNQRIWK